MKKKILIPAAAVLAVGAGGLGIAQFASADPTTPAPSSTASPGTTTKAPGTKERGMGHKGGKGMHGFAGVNVDELATKLGVDADKLKTAARNAAQALKPTDGTTKPDPATMKDQFAEAVAKELGIDKAKVTAAIDELVAARTAERTAAFKTRLDQAVTDGKLTQAEADAVMKAAEAGVIGMGGGRR